MASGDGIGRGVELASTEDHLAIGRRQGRGGMTHRANPQRRQLFFGERFWGTHPPWRRELSRIDRQPQSSQQELLWHESVRPHDHFSSMQYSPIFLSLSGELASG
jgi:hypothetical protein